MNPETKAHVVSLTHSCDSKSQCGKAVWSKGVDTESYGRLERKAKNMENISTCVRSLEFQRNHSKPYNCQWQCPSISLISQSLCVRGHSG